MNRAITIRAEALSGWLKKRGFTDESKALDEALMDALITKKIASSDYWDFHVNNPPADWPSSNFSPEDLMSKGNKRVKIYKPALTALDQIASNQPAGKPVRLTNQTSSSKNGAYRDKKFNSQVGGASGSWHVHGKAFDIDVSDYSKEERLILLQALVDVGFIGFGHGRGVIHADMGRKRYWTYGGYKKPKEEEYRGGTGGSIITPNSPEEKQKDAPMDMPSCEESIPTSAGLSEGSSGSEVKFVQLTLEALGYLPGEEVDCNFGSKTKEALIAFQRDSGLTGSGEVDADTLAFFKALNNPSHIDPTDTDSSAIA